MRNNQRRLGSAPRPQPSPAPVASDLAFASPTEFVELPSQGEFYPEDHPLHKQETVEIRFMTAKDEDILSSQALLKKGLAINRLLESLLVLDIDPKSLLLGDKNAILIAARVSGYGSDYEVTITCPSCASTSEFEYDLKNAERSGECFNEKFLHENNITLNTTTGTLDLVLPVSGVEIGLSLVDGYIEQEYSTGSKSSENAVVTNLLSSFVTKVNDKTDYKSVIAFIEAMPAKDSRFLRELYPQLVPNIRLAHRFMCDQCFYVKEMEVPLTAAFFWPG